MPRLDNRTAAVVDANGQPFYGYQMVQVNSVPAYDGPCPYSNYVHRNGRVILCMFNFAEMDTNIGNRMHWSDLMAVSASRAASVNGATSMEELEAIWRISIVNNETNAVIAAIDGRLFGPSTDLSRCFDLTPEDGDEFSALLGTVHRKGPLRMLAAISEILWMQDHSPSEGISRTLSEPLLVPRKAAATRPPGGRHDPPIAKGEER